MAIGRPRVEIREFDQTASIESVTQFQVGLVGFSEKGPINVPTLITNKKDFETTFGKIGYGSDLYPSASYLGYALDFYLDEGNAAYVVRGASNSGAFAYVDIGWESTGTSAGKAISGGASSISGIWRAKAALSALTATSANSASPPASASIRVFAKSQGDFANYAYRVVPLNYQFFQCAVSSNSASVLPPVADRPSDFDEFYLAVYSSAGTLLEEYVGSLTKDKTNAKGDNIYIEHLVNNNSSYITVQSNDAASAGSYASGVASPAIAEYMANYPVTGWRISTYAVGSATSAESSVVSGKYDLSGCAAANLTTGLDALENTNDYQIRGLAAPGMTDSTTTQKVKTVAETRGDCVGYFDYERASVSTILTARPAMNSTWVAGYSNWFKYFDAQNDRWLYLPPTIQALRATAKTWNDYSFFYAPAGMERGALVDVTELDYKYVDGDLDILASNQINPLTQLKNEGNVIWGQKTSYSIASDFRDLNIRFLFITVEQAIAAFARVLIFRFNNAVTRD